MHPQPEEHYLALSGGRILAYAHGGDVHSSEVVIFFHGVFGVGTATRLAPVFAERGIHYVAPTLPGWGRSSSPPPSQSFYDCLYEDVTALIGHLHPRSEKLRLYVGGGSYGTVPAQMLYGASHELFPLARHIAGLLLLAPFSPPHCHTEYTQCLSWMNYFAVGPPTQVVPYKLLQRIGSSVISSKVDTPEHAAEFIREFAFTRLTPLERMAFEKWKSHRGMADGQAEKDIGETMHRSVRDNWDGFLAVADVLNSDWGGYDPRAVGEGRAAPVLIVMTYEDKDNRLMGEWLVKNMKNTTARYEQGGHMAALFVMDDIWAQFIGMASSAPTLSMTDA